MFDVQIALATKELTPITTLDPPARLGPPESPKHVPPLLEWILMNSSLMLLLLWTSVLGA